jgi:hypothetical protein
MGMFDWYRPAGELRCLIDGHLLSEWQGKDGPCALFLWQEGADHPVDQLVDEEVRLLPEEWERFTLPESFTIYSHDCPHHQPIDAIYTARNGTWSLTKLQSPLSSE